MAKNEIPKISDFQCLGLCDGFAKVDGSLKPLEVSTRAEMLSELRTPKTPLQLQKAPVASMG